MMECFFNVLCGTKWIPKIEKALLQKKYLKDIQK